MAALNAKTFSAHSFAALSFGGDSSDVAAPPGSGDGGASIGRRRRRLARHRLAIALALILDSLDDI